VPDGGLTPRQTGGLTVGNFDFYSVSKGLKWTSSKLPFLYWIWIILWHVSVLWCVRIVSLLKSCCWGYFSFGLSRKLFRLTCIWGRELNTSSLVMEKPLPCLGKAPTKQVQQPPLARILQDWGFVGLPKAQNCNRQSGMWVHTSYELPIRCISDIYWT
jgi:hypothetical protein